jgi:hypothetical protein
VDLTWTEGRPVRAVIAANATGRVRLRADGTMRVQGDGRAVRTTRRGADVEFAATVGRRYVVAFTHAP